MQFFLFILLGSNSYLSSAESALREADFEAFTKGHTLYNSQNGKVYGAEALLEVARVRWSFLDRNCLFGRWYEAGESIYFDYGSEIDIQCWRFFKGDSGLLAEFDGDGDSLPLYEAYRVPSPVKCPGPDVGV